MDHWLDHLEEAERFLDLAKARSAEPAKASEPLYKALVEIVYASDLLYKALHPDLAGKME